MPRKQRYTADQVVQAIRGTKGFLTLAAKRLGCTLRTLENYANRYESVKEAVRENKETMLDIAEGKLFEQIQDSNMTAIIFFLKNKGKGRG